MLRTTVGQLLVDDALPPELRRPGRVLDSKGIKALFQELAEKYPEQYKDVAHKLTRLGHDVAYSKGGLSFGVRHLRPARAAREVRAKIQGEIDQILADPKLEGKAQEEAIVKVLQSRAKDLEDAVYKESLEEENPLALQVLSGVRGNKTNLRTLRGGDLLYVDHRDRPIPVPVLRSYSEGLTPAQYWAGAYGARKGTVDTKKSTADAGYLCLAAGTRVRMADGSTRSIEDIRIGDEVLGADRAGRTFPTRVTATIDNGERSVNRYRFRLGKARNTYLYIEATEDHKVLARIHRGSIHSERGRKASVVVPTVFPLRRASGGFRLVPSQGRLYDWGIHEPRALLLGLLLGDGAMSGRSLTLSCGDPELVDELGDYVASIGVVLRLIQGHAYEYSVRDLQRTTQERDALGRPLRGGFRHRIRRWLSELGLLGKTAPYKFIPDAVRDWDNRSVAALVAGLMASDGCVTRSNNTSTPVILVTMTAKGVIAPLRQLLAERFGIHATAPREDKVPAGRLTTINGYTYVIQGRHPGWTITISDRTSVERFAANIAIPGRRGRLLQQLVAEMRPPHRAQEFLYTYVDQVPLGLRHTYDIEVEHADSLFVLANGAIVSNSKVLVQAAHRLIVSARDHDEPPDVPRGMPADTSDSDNVGALLAHDIGGFKRNTVITAKVLKQLQDQGLQRVLVRSPIAGGPREGGVYARDVGLREKGTLPPIGDYVGIAASHSLAEPLTQMMLSSKHSGGVAGAGASSQSGFKAVFSLISPPKVYPGAASHAQRDGKVERVEAAPQGGWYVHVAGQSHYVPADAEVTAKPGDLVEAGDVLSSGVPNPSEIVKHKGVGEGRRYFVNSLKQVYANSGVNVHRRNVELLARGLIDHVRLTGEWGPYVPDDVVPYSMVERDWEPREGTVAMHPASAVGKFLEKPVLHYTIGTRVRPGVVKDLQHFGVNQVHVHPEEPPFRPELQRGVSALQHDPEWVVRHLGSGLQKSTLNAAQRGSVADTAGPSFVSALMNPTTFGRQGLTKGWDPNDLDDDMDLDD